MGTVMRNARGSVTASSAATRRLSSAPIADEIEFLLARARTIGIIRANQALEPLGLKVRHYVLLSLAASDLTPSQRELAEFLQLDPSQIVSTIDVLEARGWVERNPSPEDRRINVLNATASGHQVVKQAQAAIVEAEDDSLADLSQDEREQLRGLLKRISFR